MLSTVKILEKVLMEALAKAVPVHESVQVTKAPAKVCADYTSPVALAVFNKYKKDGCFGHPNAKALAEAIHSAMPVCALLSRVEVANNGFLNLFICPSTLSAAIGEISRAGAISVSLGRAQEKVLVDFSSPNIAKEMHVGHLRSTILGDSICRCLEYQGHEVLRVNHLGDWGTQFGMLLANLEETYPDWEQNSPDIADLQTFYKEAKAKFDASEEVKEKSRLKVVKLQSGEDSAVRAWKYIYKVSRDYLQIIYDRLDVTITDCGESFYNSMLPAVVQECSDKGLVEESEGALILRLQKQPVPLMVRKSDGGYGYDSTDIAAVRYRLVDLQVHTAIYVTDSGQGPHFAAIFEAAQLAGWFTPPANSLVHAGFGVVLNEQGKKFKTREGKVVKLIALLDEARDRAGEELRKRVQDPDSGHNTHLTEEEFTLAAELIGVAAIKYYDLKQNRTSTYRFSFDNMLDPRGNTAVYLLYTYARIKSILEKAAPGAVQEALGTSAVLDDPRELQLALAVCRFPEVLDTVLEEFSLHKLCDLVYELSVKFSEFYNSCKVIGNAKQATRLQLCVATQILMQQIFGLLGIRPLDRI